MNQLPFLPAFTSPSGDFTYDNGHPVFIESASEIHRYDLGSLLDRAYRLGRRVQYEQDLCSYNLMERRIHILLEENRDLNACLRWNQSLVAEPEIASAEPLEQCFEVLEMIADETKTLPLDLSLLPPEKRLTYALCEVAKGSRAPIPAVVSADIAAMLECAIGNPLEGFKSLMGLIRQLLPFRESASLFFNVTLAGKSEEFRKIILTVFDQDLTFPRFLLQLKDKIKGSRWKNLRQQLDKEIKKLCFSFDECLLYGEMGLANAHLAQAIKQHIGGHSYNVLFEHIALLAPHYPLLARDRVLEIFKKDPALILQAETLLFTLTTFIYDKKKEQFLPWIETLFALGRLPPGFLSHAANLLARVYSQNSLPIALIKLPLIEQWIKGSEVWEAESFWLSIAECDLSSRETFDAVIFGVLQVAFPLDRCFKNSLSKLFLAWGLAPQEWNPSSLGPKLAIFWQQYCKEASFGERLEALQALRKGVLRSFYSEQTVAFIKLFLAEEFENRDFWKGCSGNAFIGMILDLERCLDINSRQEQQPIATMAEEIWARVRKNRAVWDILLEDQNTLYRCFEAYNKICQGLSKEDSLLMLMNSIQKESLINHYAEAIVEYKEKIKESLSVDFSKTCLNALKAELYKIDDEDFSVYIVRFYALGRRVMAEQSLLDWGVLPFTVSRLEALHQIWHLRSKNEDSYPNDPILIDEKALLSKVFLDAVLQGSIEVWHAFKLNMAKFGFSALNALQKSGASDIELKEAMRKLMHREAFRT